mgnify:CR=1 FL=1
MGRLHGRLLMHPLTHSQTGQGPPVCECVRQLSAFYAQDVEVLGVGQ